MDPKQKKVLTACVIFSFSIHMVLLLLLQTHSLWFYSPGGSRANPLASSLEKVQRDQVLKETFAKSFAKAQRSPQAEELPLSFFPSPLSYQAPPSPELFPKLLSLEEMLSAHAFPVRSFSLPTLDLLLDLPKDLIVPSKEKKAAPKLFNPQSEAVDFSPQEIALSPAPEKQQTLLAFSPSKNASPLQEEALKAVPTIPIPALPEVPTLADLETVNISSSFEAELTFFPRIDGPGYLFSLTLIPRPDLQIPKINQRFLFLIDRANSVQYDRLIATKTAVLRAIEELDEGDSYNIIAYDNKTEKLSPSFVKAHPDTLPKTAEFLNKIQLGSFFSPSDPYRSLFLTIPHQVEDDEIYTAILLTDGESLAKKTVQEAMTRDWTLQNQGRVSLYAVGMESDPHLATLDTACHFNKGRLIYTNSHRGLKRKLLKLTKNISHPIAKNITLKAISKSPNAKIQIYPTPSPSLYLDQPYVLLGTTDAPDDFILFVQGRLKDQWLNIKKTISFVNAKKGGNFLKAEVALQKAYQHYAQYLMGKDPKQLVEAHALLDPYNLQVAFQ